MIKDHLTKEEASRTFQKSLDEAVQEERWMAAVWKIDSEGMIHPVNVTTWNFPHGDFQKCMVMLKEVLDKQSAGELTDEPLPSFEERFGPIDTLEDSR